MAKLKIHRTLCETEIPDELFNEVQEKNPDKEIQLSFDTSFCLPDLEDDESVCWGDGENFVFVLKDKIKDSIYDSKRIVSPKI